MRTLGIDFGSKRVGIAMSDETSSFAMPLTTLINDGTLVKEIKEMSSKNGITMIVIGDAKKMDGTRNDISDKLDSFIQDLKNEGLSVVVEPEFLTSHQAERLQYDLGGDKEKKDATASAIILQSYLDRVKMSNK